MKSLDAYVFSCIFREYIENFEDKLTYEEQYKVSNHYYRKYLNSQMSTRNSVDNDESMRSFIQDNQEEFNNEVIEEIW